MLQNVSLLRSFYNDLKKLLTFLFSLFTNFVFGQQCHDYTCVIAKVERLLKQKQKDYKALLDNLDSAEGYPDSKAEQIRGLRRRVFLAIEKEKEETKRAKDDAKKQTTLAKTEKEEINTTRSNAGFKKEYLKLFFNPLNFI